jgi:hypothetical protein
LTENVQAALAANVAPLRLTLPPPAAAVMVPPPQEPLSPLGVATTSPPGKVSVKPTPVNEVPVFGLLMVKLRLVLPFSGMDATPKLLLIDGGAITVTDVMAVPPVPPLADVACT